MSKKRFALIAGLITVAVIIFSLLLPNYLDGVGVERAFNHSYGKYNDLWLENTHYDGTNQKVIIKTQFSDIKDIDETNLINASKEFVMEIKKYDIPKEIESIWILFTNPQGHSIGSMWTDVEHVKKVKWSEATDSQFKNAMNFK